MREFEQSRSISASCLRKMALPILPRPDFLVIFEGCSLRAEHQHCSQEALKRSLKPDLLQT